MIDLIRIGDDTDHGGKVETGSHVLAVGSKSFVSHPRGVRLAAIPSIPG